MPPLSDIVLLLLGGWWTYHVLRWEDGPFGFVEYFRVNMVKIDVHYNDNKGIILTQEETDLQKLFTCIICLGFWVGLSLYLFWALWPPLIVPFGIAGGIVLVETVLKVMQKWL